MTRELLKQALNALNSTNLDLHADAVEAIRAHLAQPQSEPTWHDAPTVPGLWVSSVWNARHFSRCGTKGFGVRNLVAFIGAPSNAELCGGTSATNAQLAATSTTEKP